VQDNKYFQERCNWCIKEEIARVCHLHLLHLGGFSIHTFMVSSSQDSGVNLALAHSGMEP
jgi:hypothetical protein